jgi:hypothetical protein
VRYQVQARILENRMEDFFARLSDGSVESQKPDGREIVASMRRARLVGPSTIAWCETCYCSTPLAHERETVYDHFLTEIETTLIEEDPPLEGDSFWDHLESLHSSHSS